MGTSAIKYAARTLLPDRVAIPLSAIRARRHSQKLNREWDLHILSHLLFDNLGDAVVNGPFAGLVIPREAAAEHIGPYLLGTYERELHDHWASLQRGSVPLVVNIGSKFGYYAVGLSRSLDAPAIAYDADPWARRMTRLTAGLNGVSVDVRGSCRRAHLRRLPPGTLAVIDCDGGEESLLRDPLPEGLVSSSIVLELHGELVERDEMADRLSRTHHVRAVPSREAPAPPKLDFLTEHQCRMAVEEIRSAQRWLLCTPRGT